MYELAKRLRLTILRNLEILEPSQKWVGDKLALLLLTSKKLVLVVKNYAKTDIKIFSSYLILLNFFTLSHKSYPR